MTLIAVGSLAGWKDEETRSTKVCKVASVVGETSDDAGSGLQGGLSPISSRCLIFTASGNRPKHAWQINRSCSSHAGFLQHVSYSVDTGRPSHGGVSCSRQGYFELQQRLKRHT